MISEPWGISEARLRKALQEAGAHCLLNKLRTAGGPQPLELLHKFQSVCYSLLRVSTGDEAVALLVSSSRVMQDISHTMDHGKAGWDVSVVARVWDNQVMLDREFRAFVVGGHVVAISQYDDQLCYPFVVDHPEEIVSTIMRGMNDARPCLESAGLASPAMAVVIDFLVVPSQDNQWLARVIELNPFGPMTGASLFCWRADRSVLQGGCDLYGDLEDCDQQACLGSIDLPKWVTERIIDGVPFRYLVAHPAVPGYCWQKLEAFWPDYMRVASEEEHATIVQ